MRQLLLACLVVTLITAVICYSKKAPVEASASYPQPARMISSIDDVFRHLCER
ncbi:hypothetical protein D9M71_733650 [compost metagenome]